MSFIRKKEVIYMSGGGAGVGILGIVVAVLIALIIFAVL